MHKCFLGFGAGSRKCLGQNIALWLGQKLVVQVRSLDPQIRIRLIKASLDQLLRRFDMSVKNPDQPCRIENYGIDFYFEQFIYLKSR